MQSAEYRLAPTRCSAKGRSARSMACSRPSSFRRTRDSRSTWTDGEGPGRGLSGGWPHPCGTDQVPETEAGRRRPTRTSTPTHCGGGGQLHLAKPELPRGLRPRSEGHPPPPRIGHGAPSAEWSPSWNQDVGNGVRVTGLFDTERAAGTAPRCAGPTLPEILLRFSAWRLRSRRVTSRCRVGREAGWPRHRP